MSSKLFIVAIIAIASCNCEDIKKEPKIATSNRQKRLLFYDEDGNLVKTFSGAGLGAFGGGFTAPFITYFRPYSIALPALAVPVSAAAAAAAAGPMALALRSGGVERNALCDGRRDQIPSTECGEFLNCWDGWAFAQQCPAGLHFSELGFCDYPRNVDCLRRRRAEPAPQRCIKDFEAFSSASCREFFVCVNGDPVRFECPKHLLYNQELGICDYAYNVNCSGSAARAQATDKPSDVTTTARPDVTNLKSDVTNLKITVTRDNVHNSESWSAHVASSRQDAIRQLEQRNAPKPSTN